MYTLRAAALLPSQSKGPSLRSAGSPDADHGRPRALQHGAGKVAAIGAMAIAVASLPVFSTVLPPLVDYPNHLARFWLIETGGNQFYSVRWSPLPNLAGDLLVPLLGQAMPLEIAGKLFLVTIFALLVGGAAWVNRMAHGSWRLWPLLVVAFVYNRSFLWGFTNYLFGLGVALCGLALWLACENARPWLRVLSSSLVAAMCFFSHIAALGVYGLLILGVEVRPALAELRTGTWGALRRRALLGAAQFILPAGIFLTSWRPAASGGVFYTAIWRKPDLLFSVFDNYNRPFDIACFAALLALFAGLAWYRRLHLAPRLAPALGLLFAAYLLLPSQILSGSGADHRLAAALFVVFVAATAPCLPNRRAAGLIGAAVAAVLLARFAVIENVWLRADRVYRGDLAAIDALPRHATLALGFSAGTVNVTAIPELHVPTLAVMRRDAFVPTLFAYAAQQPLAIKPPYDRLASETDPQALWSGLVAGNRDLRDRVERMLADWDAVALVDRRPFTVPALRCLEPLGGGPTLQVYRVRRGEPCVPP